MEQEIWKDIAGYEGLYQVSNMGRVKSLNYNHTKKERLLKPVVKSSGYLEVMLCKDGKMKHFRVHRLVGQAFLPNPNNLPQVNHKDENPKNNCVFNLEFCDAEYNNNYGTRTERAAETKSKPVLQLDLQGNFVKRWHSIIDAEREGGFNHGAIGSCCQGKRNTHHGYRWQYAEDYKPKQTTSEALF